MARSNDNLKSVLQDTADAIRAKKGTDSLIVPRDFADEIASITGGGGGEMEAGTFDFSGSAFSTLSTDLFKNNTSINNVKVKMPSTLSSITTNAFNGAEGNYKVYFDSVPTISNSNFIPSSTASLTIKYYFTLPNDAVIDAANWSGKYEQIIFIDTNVAQGTMLQPYTKATGAEITWYSDDDTFSNVVTESYNVNATYYGRVLNPSTRITYCFYTMTLSYASFDAVDEQGNHYNPNNIFIPIGRTITITPVSTNQSKNVLTMFIVNDVDYTQTGTVTLTVNSNINITVMYNDTLVDPVLNNNSWQIIKNVCEDGLANNYWAVGDTKTDIGTDGLTRTFRIVDMQGLYGKHVVFEQVELEVNHDSLPWYWDNGYKQSNYSTSDIIDVVFPTIIIRYSNELQTNLTNTSVKVATSGKDFTIIEVTNKLFLEAEKEIYNSSTSNKSIPEEFSVLTTYDYYVTHTGNVSRQKQTLTSVSGAKNWWLRSPCDNTGSIYLASVCAVETYGSLVSIDSSGQCFVAPCFSF